MNDLALLAVTILLVGLAAFDWYVAYRFVRPALDEPPVSMLTLAALRSVAIAVAGTIFAALAIAVAAALWVDVRLIPMPWFLILLIIGAAIASLANLYALRVLQEDE